MGEVKKLAKAMAVVRKRERGADSEIDEMGEGGDAGEGEGHELEIAEVVR